jgi:hypothetical protein
VLTGDSFVQGACVQSGEDLAAQIRLVTGDSALALGMSGNGPLLMLAGLKEYAEFRKPKNVLWFYYEGNDMNELKKEKSSSLMMNYLQPEFSQNLIRRQTEIDNKLENFINEAAAKLKAGWDSSQNDDTTLMWHHDTLHKFLIGTRMLRLFNIRAQLGIDSDYSAQSFIKTTESVYIDPLFTEILRQAKDQTAAWGGKLYFIYLPARERYLQDAQSHDIFLKRREVIEVAKNIGLPVIDIHKEVFANHPKPRSLFQSRVQAHYNATGYSEIVRAIILRVRD